MRGTTVTAGAVFALALLAGSASAHDADVFRLDMKKGAAVSTLGLQGEADVTLARGYRNYGYHHNYRPYYSYYPRNFGYSYYPRYHSYYPRAYSFNFGYSYYRPFYSSYYYPPPVYYYSAPANYYAPPVYYYSAPAYCPISLSFALGSAAGSITLGRDSYAAPPAMELMPPADGRPRDGTYPYDGGPRDPVPMPKAAPEPTKTPPVTVPAEGRFASLPAKPAKFAYPAYGEDARPTSFAADRVAKVKSDVAKKDGR